jgi:signal transduction histidine kinase
LNKRFEERLEERTRIARDFHDTLLQTIQGSKMVADTALLQNAGLPQMRSRMEELSEWLGRAVHEGRSALSSLRSSIGEGNELAEAFRRAGEEYRFRHPMELNLVVEGPGKEMHPIVRDEVYRIGYEAIRNAFTHSGGARVDVELSYVSDLVLRVRDDGRGFDGDVGRKERDGHFGVIGMHERAARIGAKLTISTSPTGTEVELRIPRSVVFQGSTPGSKSAFQRLKKLF